MEISGGFPLLLLLLCSFWITIFMSTSMSAAHQEVDIVFSLEPGCWDSVALGWRRYNRFSQWSAGEEDGLVHLTASSTAGHL